MEEGKCRRFYKTLVRKKGCESEKLKETTLIRCLNKWDVTAAGVGSTLGVGVYVIFGHVALNMAGPSVVLSFLIAAVAALFAGLCFAEFGARLPRAGGAYSYTYLALGELVAFVVGWNNILQGLCCTAGMARLLSLYTNSAFNMSMSQWIPIETPTSFNLLSPFFDIVAFLLIVFMGGLLVVGARESTLVNNLFLAASLLLVVFIIIIGAFAADTNNLQLPPESVPAGGGGGGLFPFGVREMLKGAAICFYGFMGFDAICAAGEEVQEPRRTIPITILSVLGVTFLCYMGIAVVISMLVPYFLLHDVMAIAEAFQYVSWGWARWIVAVGSLFGLYCCMFGSMFPLTRLLYAMSCDGLLPRRLAPVTALHSPSIVTLICTVVAGLLAGFVETKALLQIVAIGALISYTSVAASVIVLRYYSTYTPGEARYVKQVFGLVRAPTRASCRVINLTLILFMFLALANALVITQTEGWRTLSWLILSALLNAIALVLLLVMTVQPQIKHEIYFKTPLVPLVPCLSIYINIHLMVLNIADFNNNWLILGVWILIGIIIYLISICCCKRQQKKNFQENIALSYPNNNGKPRVQIIVESPTPPDTLSRISDYGGEVQIEETIQEKAQESFVRKELPVIQEEIILHQASIENNEEKEAKIIDLLDQVLQAEEDSYGEVSSIKEQKDDDTVTAENTLQRKSLSELSDAGSDASFGNQGLSKYDVIAQVHREDLPKLNEEEERIEKEAITDDEEIEDHEQVTAFNDSDTNSRTDESGYSDTIDRNALSESMEESKEEITTIPIPPPFDENYFKNPKFRNSYTIGTKHRNFARNEEEDRENKPRESIKSVMSNGSQSEDNITFGSDRQIHFMSKLNNIFQNKITNEDEEPRKRSHSTGNVVENTDYSISRERTPLFLALKGEIISKEAAQNLRPVNFDEKGNIAKEDDSTESLQSDDKEEDTSMTKDELKSKLENIFAAGGPQLLKPRLMKSNPPTPEDNYTDVSSTESILKLPKMEKNDTLKRQKAKFNEVLNSFRISMNQEDAV